MKKAIYLFFTINLLLSAFSFSLNAQSCKAPSNVVFSDFAPHNLSIKWTGGYENQGYLLFVSINDEHVFETFVEEPRVDLNELEFNPSDRVVVEIASVCHDGSQSDIFIAKFDSFIVVDIVFMQDPCHGCEYKLCDNGIAYPCDCGCPSKYEQPACVGVIAYNWSLCSNNNAKIIDQQYNTASIIQLMAEPIVNLEIQKVEETSLSVYNQAGQKVYTFYHDQVLPIGQYAYTINHNTLGQGMFYVVFEGENSQQVLKLIQVK